MWRVAYAVARAWLVAGDVLARINKDAGRTAADAFKSCNEGPHLFFEGDTVNLVHESEKLARWLQRRT